jgi:hypothetical protein
MDPSVRGHILRSLGFILNQSLFLAEDALSMTCACHGNTLKSATPSSTQFSLAKLVKDRLHVPLIIAMNLK